MCNRAERPPDFVPDPRPGFVARTPPALPAYPRFGFPGRGSWPGRHRPSLPTRDSASQAGVRGPDAAARRGEPNLSMESSEFGLDSAWQAEAERIPEESRPEKPGSAEVLDVIAGEGRPGHGYTRLGAANWQQSGTCFNAPMQPAVERRARAAAERIRRTAGADVERLRQDAGLPRTRLADAAGLDDSFLRRVEQGTVSPSVETYARLAAVLGADLALRLYPNTGPAIRDRHQAGILEALLASKHPRWHAYSEVAVRRPSRGWIDVALHDPRERTMVATEIQSELRRVEQLVRWSEEKAASLPSWDGWAQLGEPPTISRLIVVRQTRTTRRIAGEFRRQLRAAYPADPRDAFEALTTATVAWPGAAILWATGRGTAAEPWRIAAPR
ncbi:MAG: XRE family transcriptional regulator [Chloroflexota bacterium]|nr:MAG: XRE family transcriptional regulator [Chloroflexota bacterium]